MEQKNSLIITKNNLETITKYCELNQIENLNFFMNDCLKKGLDLKIYGLLGNDSEKTVEKEIIVEKRVEIPVEVIKEVEKIVEVPVEIIKEIIVEKEIPVEKIVTKIVNISDKDDEIIFQLKQELEEERVKFSTKIKEMENFFQKEKDELISQIEKNKETKFNDKTKLLEGTLQNLKKELNLKDDKINELIKQIKELETYTSNKGAIYMKGSNLNQNL